MVTESTQAHRFWMASLLHISSLSPPGAHDAPYKAQALPPRRRLGMQPLVGLCLALAHSAWLRFFPLS